MSAAGLCADTLISCNNLSSCQNDNLTCTTPNTVCVNNTRCKIPVCFPIERASAGRCPPLNSSSSSVSTSTVLPTTMTTATTITATPPSTTGLYTASTATCNSTIATPCVNTTMLVANCQSYEVSWNNHCYYLDGSGGVCVNGYTLGTNAVLGCIASQFTGKNYRNTTSSNCCIWTADTYECYGMNTNCNSAGPFSSAPIINGAWCANAHNYQSQQLTFCGSV
ncbi:unnamed protein product [Rotaria magnacalcarata]